MIADECEDVTQRYQHGRHLRAFRSVSIVVEIEDRIVRGNSRILLFCKDADYRAASRISNMLANRKLGLQLLISY